MFTFREKTVKSVTVADAIASAKNILKQRNITTFCTNAVSNRDPQEKITVEQMSDLVEQIVDDTRYHLGY